MAGILIEVTIADAPTRALLAALRARAGALQPAFREIGSMLKASTRQRFEAERGPSGQRWARLAQSTQRKRVTKAARRGGANILRNKGLLYASITYLATTDDVRVGTNKRYAAIHQLGGTPDMAAGPAAIPARPFLGLDAADEVEIGAILAKHLARGV